MKEIVDTLIISYAENKKIHPTDVVIRPALPEDFENGEDRWWLITGIRKGNVRIAWRGRYIAIGYGDIDFLKPVVITDNNWEVHVKMETKGNIYSLVRKEECLDYIKIYTIEMDGRNITKIDGIEVNGVIIYG